MNQITRFEFENKPLTFEKIDGEWWATADEAAEALGYSGRNKINELFRKHQRDFLPSESVMATVKAAHPKRGAQVVQGRRVRLYSPRGLEHLAMLGASDTCRRFRRWLLDDVLGKLHDGARIVTADQLTQVVAAVRSEYAQQIGLLMNTINGLVQQNHALAGAVSVQASSAGKLLAYLAHSPEARAALDAARDKTPDLPFPHVNRLPEAA